MNAKEARRITDMANGVDFAYQRVIEQIGMLAQQGQNNMSLARGTSKRIFDALEHNGYTVDRAGNTVSW